MVKTIKERSDISHHTHTDARTHARQQQQQQQQHLVSLAAAGGGASADGLHAMPHSQQHRDICVNGDHGYNR